MAEVLVQFTATLPGPGGRRFLPRVCGRRMPGSSLWEGWIEFVPEEEAAVLRTRRETEQPNRADLHYWATGLSTAYLEGALARALEPARPHRRGVAATPAYEGPAPERAPEKAGPPSAEPEPSSVLEPFEVYRQGEDVLRRELLALDATHLRNLVRAHRLADEASLDLAAMSRAALAELIVAAVRKRAAPRSGD